jgi:hypothetical protein
MNDHPPDISIYNRINERGFLENGKGVRDFRLELGAEAGSLRLLPDFGFSYI